MTNDRMSLKYDDIYLFNGRQGMLFLETRNETDPKLGRPFALLHHGAGRSLGVPVLRRRRIRSAYQGKCQRPGDRRNHGSN